jgi:hypothetical protein
VSIRVQQVAPPALTPGTVALITEALLPLVGWRDVPVLREVREELTVLERFVLEMALRLGVVTAEDFAEVMSLPRQVLAAGATRLIAGRALRLVGDRYEVEPSTAAKALATQGISRRLTATADFLLLPRTGDVLAMAPGRRSWLRQFEIARLAPSVNAPVPAELWPARRSAYLAERLHAGAVTVQDTEVADLATVPDDPPLFASAGGGAVRLCPTYACSAEVVLDEDGRHTVHAVLRSAPRRRRRGKTESGEPVELAVRLTGAPGLIAEWVALSGALTDPAVRRAAWAEIGPGGEDFAEMSWRRARLRAPLEWDFPITERAATAVAAQYRPLDRPVGLTLSTDTATAQVVCWFVPDDDATQALFAMDAAVGGLLARPDPAADAVEVCGKAAAEHQVHPTRIDLTAVRERAWQLGHHSLVYALREAEDFPYD